VSLVSVVVVVLGAGERATFIARVVLPPPGFDKEAVSRGLEKIGTEVVARM